MRSLLVTLARKNGFILTVLGLSFLCAALSEARADVKGIPFNSQFSTASFPYARTLQNCTEWRRPERFGDVWGPVSFAGACQEHDRCYHTPGNSWGDCNQHFLSDLQASCDRDLATERLGKSKLGKTDPQAQTLCYQIANLYFAKVQDKDSARRFELAQKQEQEYLGYVRGVIDGVFKSVLKRAASSKELDQALKTLVADYTLDDLKAALMGERIDRDAEASAMPEIDETAVVPTAASNLDQ